MLDSRETYPAVSLRLFLRIASDTVLGLMFWSVESYFPEAIFAFPLFAMTISGWEIFAFVPIVLFLIAHEKLRSVNTGIMMLVAVIACSLSFYGNPAQRLPALALAETAIVSILASRIWQQNSALRRRTVFGLLMGLLVLLTLRLYFRSLNPIWIDEAYSLTLGFLGLFSAVVFSLEEKTTVITRSPRLGWLRAGLGTGGAIFILMLLATSPGVVARWVELNPWPLSLWIPIAVSLGALASTLFPDKIQTFRFWAVVAFGGGVLLSYAPRGLGYVGGVAVVMYAAGILPSSFDRLSLCNPGKSLTALLLVRMLLCFFNVWVVAYKFVPLGFLLRERLDLNLLLPIVFMGFGLVRYRRRKDKESVVPKGRSEKRFLRALVFVCLAVTFLCLQPVAAYRSNRIFQAVPPSMNATGSSVEGKFMGLIWTIHFGYDNNGRNNFDLLVAEMRRLRPDVIGFLETDTTRVFTGNADPVEYVGEELGYHTYFGPSTRHNTWGCALYSAWPILRAESVVLPSPEGELACLIDADINLNGTVTTVFVTHFGNKEDELDRKLQNEAVATMAERDSLRDHPLIFLGYFTMKPFSDKYQRFERAGMLDSAPHLPDRWCQYIWYRHLTITGFSKVDQPLASDTEIQIAQFLLPKNNQQ